MPKTSYTGYGAFTTGINLSILILFSKKIFQSRNMDTIHNVTGFNTFNKKKENVKVNNFSPVAYGQGKKLKILLSYGLPK